MKKEILLLSRLIILEEACQHFNLINRSTLGHGCKYYPPKKESEGCAVGRLIEDKELCKRLDNASSSGICGVFDRLPSDLKDLGQDFLTDLQNLHDIIHNWDAKGLSERGIEQKQDIFKKYCE